MKYDRSVVRDIVGWDIATWRIALRSWDGVLPEDGGGSALELGSGRGGISLYLALKGFSVICSDIGSPAPVAKPLHQKYSVAEQISYQSIDATAIPLPDSSLDVIAFKSLLGGIGKNGNKASQSLVMHEIYRLLKPGGLLLFAENLTGSRIHMYLRRRFVRWGRSWNYLGLDEMRQLLSAFSHHHIETAGFLSTLGRAEWQRSCLHAVDRVILPLVPESQRHLMCGWARK